MEIKKTAAIILIFLFAVSLILYWATGETAAPGGEDSRIDDPFQSAGGNGFYETGNMVKNNSGLKPDVWYLVYEKPGSPAVNVEISLKADSSCITRGVSQSCEKISFSYGQRVNVKGVKVGAIVKADSIEIISE